MDTQYYHSTNFDTMVLVNYNSFSNIQHSFATMQKPQIIRVCVGCFIFLNAEAFELDVRWPSCISYRNESQSLRKSHKTPEIMPPSSNFLLLLTQVFNMNHVFVQLWRFSETAWYSLQ